MPTKQLCICTILKGSVRTELGFPDSLATMIDIQMGFHTLSFTLWPKQSCTPKFDRFVDSQLVFPPSSSSKGLPSWVESSLSLEWKLFQDSEDSFEDGKVLDILDMLFISCFFQLKHQVKAKPSQRMACGNAVLSWFSLQCSKSFRILKIYSKFKAWRSTSRNPSWNAFIFSGLNLGKNKYHILNSYSWADFQPSQVPPLPLICSRNLSFSFSPKHMNLSWCRIRIYKVGSSILNRITIPTQNWSSVSGVFNHFRNWKSMSRKFSTSSDFHS